MKINLKLDLLKISKYVVIFIIPFLIGTFVGLKANDTVIDRVVERETMAWNFIVSTHNILDIARQECLRNDDVEECARNIYIVQTLIKTYTIMNFPGEVEVADSTQSSGKSIAMAY